MKNIYIVGPSSTGKTTLCTSLFPNLNIPQSHHLTEIARTVMQQTGYTRNTVHDISMQKAILQAQLSRELPLLNLSLDDKGPGEKNKENNNNILCDRSGIDPMVYAIMTSRDTTEKESRKKELMSLEGFNQVLESYQDRNVSLFILLTPVEEWLVDDGIRSLESGEECTSIFKELLGELGIHYFTLGPETKSLDNRTKLILELAGG